MFAINANVVDNNNNNNNNNNNKIVVEGERMDGSIEV
jgi:hypothetical protein